ncbi:hypothetical protein D9M70_206160 [compost metagenome]
MDYPRPVLVDAIFRTPTSAAVVFSDIEALILHLGGQVLEREGSRGKVVLGDVQWNPQAGVEPQIA